MLQHPYRLRESLNSKHRDATRCLYEQAPTLLTSDLMIRQDDVHTRMDTTTPQRSAAHRFINPSLKLIDGIDFDEVIAQRGDKGNFVLLLQPCKGKVDDDVIYSNSERMRL